MAWEAALRLEEGMKERLPDVAWWTVEVEEKAGRIERSDA